MTLTILNAPFGSNPDSFNFERGPAHVLYFEDSPRRVRVKLTGVTVESGVCGPILILRLSALA